MSPVEAPANGAPGGQEKPQGEWWPGWVLSYPSRPDKGTWHKVHPEYYYETLCSRDISWDWHRVGQFPQSPVTDKICKQCLKWKPEDCVIIYSADGGEYGNAPTTDGEN